MRHKYRILAKTNGLQQTYYYIQKRFLFFFWRNMSYLAGLDYYAYVCFGTLKEAKEKINNLIKSDIETKLFRQTKSKKIIYY